MSWRDLDEGDIRVRPSRKGSRPRTKERPAHVDAVVAMVIGVDRGRYTCLIPRGALGKKEPERVVTAMKAREIGRTRVVVGDDVALVGDLAGGPDALARIVRQRPTKSGRVLAVVSTSSTTTPGTRRPSTAPAVAMRWSW